MLVLEQLRFEQKLLHARDQRHTPARRRRRRRRRFAAAPHRQSRFLVALVVVLDAVLGLAASTSEGRGCVASLRMRIHEDGHFLEKGLGPRG